MCYVSMRLSNNDILDRLMRVITKRIKVPDQFLGCNGKKQEINRVLVKEEFMSLNGIYCRLSEY